MRNQYDAGSIAGTVLIIKLILFFQFTTKGFSIYVTTIILEVTKMENKIDNIIARVLAGEASAEDILFISNWMNEKEENHKTFSLLKSYWSADIASNQYVNPSVSLEKLQDKINRHQTPGKQYLIPILLSVVASIVLIITISSFFSITSTNGKSKEYYTYLTNNNKSEFTLRDGTKVTLNKNSTLTYSDAFGKNIRSVNLEGEAFFEVATDSLRPFSVKTDGLVVKAYGTSFNINTLKPGHVYTALVEGCVGVIIESSGQEYEMTPSQLADFNPTTNQLEIWTTDLSPYISWVEGRFLFINETLEQIMNTLSLWYDFEVLFEQEELRQLHFSGSMKRYEQIDRTLDAISYTVNVSMNW